MRAWIVVLLGMVGIARGDGVTLRMAAIAPEGTGWARELRAAGRDVETGTNGAVRMKWYLGGIAGDELRALERVRRGQLDGLAGAIFCERLAPSLWVTRVVGLIHDRAEGKQVLNRLIPTATKEMEQRGFVGLSFGNFGSEILFTRRPVRSMDELRATRVWTWDLDDFWVKELPTMGVRAVALPVDKAAPAYEEQEVDGFVALPTAALAYRWSAQARYFSELTSSFMPGCAVISQRAFDQLSFDQQKVVRAAGAKLALRFDDLSEQQDHALLSGLFEHQGLKRVEVSPQFLDEFRKAADRTRVQLVATMLKEHQVPPSLLGDVIGWLAELRAQAHLKPGDKPTH